jgi:dihydropteroate synthase
MPTASFWRVRGRTLQLDRPLVMGILNVTPDSFSDGGRFFSPDAAVARGVEMAGEGADIIDVGGESTRPQGATPVSADEELSRVLPVVRELRSRLPEVVLSVDTVKSAVAASALAEGAEVVNDVSGFRLDQRMPRVCADAGAGVVLMHSRGSVSTMGTYQHAEYGAAPAEEVLAELKSAADAAVAAGVAPEALALDPGVGFAKRSAHSLAVLAALPRLAAWGHPVVVGVSRKRFIGELTGVATAAERVHGTVGANVAALMLGARVFRVHDIRPSRQALDVAWAVLAARDEGAAAAAAGGRP